MYRAFVLVAIAVTLTSCASPYAQEWFIGGFDSQQLREDVYRVRFSGNGYTSRETVQTYWLYRCAELALEKGYAGFEILSDMRFVMRRPPDRGDDRLALRDTIGSLQVAIPPSPDEFAEAHGASRDVATGHYERADLGSERVRIARGGYMVFYGGSGVEKPSLEGDIHLIRSASSTPPKLFNASALKAALEPIIKADKCGIGNVCPHVHEYLLPKGKLQ